MNNSGAGGCGVNGARDAGGPAMSFGLKELRVDGPDARLMPANVRRKK